MSIDYIKLTKKQLEDKEFDKSLLTCLTGLSLDYNNSQARLLLARIFFELKLYPFAVREIKELYSRYHDSKSLKNLLTKLDPSSVSIGSETNVQSQKKEQVLAEADFDIEFIE
jgi:hypothetical protein